MKVTFIAAVYPPEREPAGIMAAQMAERLAEDGHRVSVVCPFPNRPSGSLAAGHSRRVRLVEEHNGLRVVRCPNWLVGKRRRWWARVLENLTFGITSAVNAWREGRPDILIVETWPLFSVQMALWLARIWGTPTVNYVQDVYPESLENAGILRTGGLIARLLLVWDRRLCAASGRVIVISEGMRALLCRTRPGLEQRVSVIHNWIDGGEIRPEESDNAWRREQGIAPDAFLAIFAGTLGTVSGADILIEAARLLQGRPDIQILCVGQGVLKTRMMRAAAQLSLSNIGFLDFQPRERVGEMHSAAGALLLTMAASAGASSVPSKLITYFASGRCVVCSAAEESDCSRAVREAQAGIAVPAGDAAGIAAALISLADDPISRSRMGRNARAYFEAHFTLDKAHQQFARILDELTREQNAARQTVEARI